MSKHRKNNRGTKKHFVNSVLSYLLVFLVLNSMAVLALFGGWIVDKFADRYETEGVVATAKVLEVDDRMETNLTNDHSGTYNANRTKQRVTTVYYSFEPESGEEIRGDYSSRDLATIPTIGDSFSIRYLKSDPNTHEARVGHVRDNSDVFYWIAFAFALISVVVAGFGVAYEFLTYFSAKQRRSRKKQRLMNELASKQQNA